MSPRLSRRKTAWHRTARRRALKIGGVIILLGLGVIVWRAKVAPDSSQYLSAGDSARKAKAYSSAAIHYKNALLVSPDNLEARWHLGQSYLALKRIPEAFSALKTAQAIGEKQPEFWLDLARAQLETGRFADTLKSLKQYQGPDHAEALALEARANLGLGKDEEAKTVLSTAVAKDPDAVSLQLATARLALSEHDLTGAAAAVTRALELAPDNPEALLVRGRIQMLQGTPAAAEATYQHVLELQKSDPAALAGALEAILSQGKTTDAPELVARLSKESPKAISVQFFQGWIAYAQNDWSGAESAMSRVITARPNHPQALLMLADSCLRQAKFNQAEAYLKTFNGFYPDQPPALKLMASLYLKEHRAQDAVNVLAPLTKLEKPDVGSLALLSYASYAAGDLQRGKAFLQRAETLAPDSKALQMQQALGDLVAGDEKAGISELEGLAKGPEAGAPRQALTYFHLMKGNNESALESAQALALLKPQDPLAQNLLGIALARIEDNTGAEEAFKKALAINSKFAPALANLGFLALSKNDVSNATDLLKKALVADGSYTTASVALAALAERRGAPAETMKLLEEAVAAQPNAAQPRWLLAERHLRVGELPEATKQAEAANAINPRDQNSRLLWASFLSRAGRPAEAVDLLQKMTHEKPDLMPAIALLGHAARLDHQWDLARSSYRTVLANSPAKADVLWGLLGVEIAEKNYSEATNVVRTMRKQLTNTEDAERANGELAAAQNRHAEAVTIFSAIQQRHPNTTNLMRLADAQQQKGDITQVDKTLSTWLDTHQEDTEVRLRLGSDQLIHGETRDAQATFEKALVHAADNAIALNNLAWLYDKAEDPRALSLAERAHRILPNSAETADTLAWILARQQAFQKALPLLEKAHSLRPDEPNIQYHEAYTLAELGNKDKARSLLEDLLAKKRPFEAENDARALLRKLSNHSGVE